MKNYGYNPPCTNDIKIKQHNIQWDTPKTTHAFLVNPNFPWSDLTEM